MQPQLRRPGQAEHFNVLPEDAARMSSAERLHRRLLRGEPTGKMGDRVSAARTIGNLPLGEDAPQETVAVTLEGRTDAGNISRVESKPEDVHDSAPA